MASQWLISRRAALWSFSNLVPRQISIFFSPVLLSLSFHSSFLSFSFSLYSYPILFLLFFTTTSSFFFFFLPELICGFTFPSTRVATVCRYCIRSYSKKRLYKVKKVRLQNLSNQTYKLEETKFQNLYKSIYNYTKFLFFYFISYSVRLTAFPETDRHNSLVIFYIQECNTSKLSWNFVSKSSTFCLENFTVFILYNIFLNRFYYLFSYISIVLRIFFSFFFYYYIF